MALLRILVFYLCMIKLLQFQRFKKKMIKIMINNGKVLFY